ncbi:MAG: PQQ-binding-like beta-propeller repeat protein [bacterium]
MGRLSMDSGTERYRLGCVVCTCFAVLFLAALPAQGEDWPTYQHDNQRSGITSEQLELPLTSSWVLAPKQTPRRAWGGSPAKHDFWHSFHDLKPRVLFDRANYATVSGDSLFFGSSSDDLLCCVEADTGVERWVFFTEGPIRLAPTVVDGRVYAGSDDGYVYCLNAADGSLIWKYKPYPNDDRIIGNERMISVCPVRTSIMVQNGVAYFCAGVFPNEGVYICALNTADGSVVWKHSVQISPQGYLLASTNRLYVPTGNTNPRVYSCADGGELGSFSYGRSGGTYALIVDDKIVSGPGYDSTSSDLLLAYDTQTTDLVAFVRGNQIIVAPQISYVQTDAELSALDRAAYFKASKQTVDLRNRKEEIGKELRKLGPKAKGKKVDGLMDEMASIEIGMEEAAKAQAAAMLWSVPCAHPFSLILAGDHLLAGGDNEVAVYDTSNGSILWTGEVTGRAYGLAVSNGSLFVSTDRGTIHQFGDDTGATQWRFY